MRQKAPFIIPVKTVLAVMAAVLGLALAGLTTLDYPKQPPPQPELAHGERFMPKVLMQRAQSLYDAAAQGDALTVQRMTHPEDRRKCSAEGLLAAVLRLDPHGRPVAADTPPDPSWTVDQAQVWHGHRTGVSSAYITEQGAGGAGQPRWNLVWSRTGSVTWRALPGCGDPEPAGDWAGA